MTEKETYQVVNTTVKPVRKDAKGRDMRSTLEKVGHAVQFYDGIGPEAREIVLHASKQCFIHNLIMPLLKLQKAGLVKITKVEDMTEVLKAHTYQPDAPAAPVAPVPPKSETPAPTLMGAPIKPSKAGGTEYEGAVNPTGNPNFLVKAPTGQPAKKAAAQKETDGAAKPGNNPTV